VTIKRTVWILILLPLLLVPAATPVLATQESFTITRGTTAVLTFNLLMGAELKGTITTNSSVRFFVNGPEQQVIVGSQIISQTSAFDFTATETGNYTLSFDNGTLNSATVTVSNNLPGSSGLNPLYYIVVVVIAAFGITLLLRRVMSKRKQNNTSR
jgi:hypothetical protein